MTARIWAGLSDRGTTIKLKLRRYDPALFRVITRMRGARRIGKGREVCYKVTLCRDNILKLKACDKAVEWARKLEQKSRRVLTRGGGNTQGYEHLKVRKIKVKGLGGKLRKFQRYAVSFCESRQGRYLNADEMGLGKTIETLAWLQYRKKLRPVVIVAPSYLCLNWVEEARKWLSKPRVTLLEGRTTRKLEPRGIYVVGYSVVHAWKDRLKDISPRVVVMDEIHYTKNTRALRTRGCISIAKKAPHVIGLTGTPIKSRPAELYNILSMIAPKIFPSFWYFMQRYCGASWNGHGFTFSGEDNAAELHSILRKTIMLRRLKKDVLKELPPKVRTVVPLQIDNRKQYRKAEQDFSSWLRGEGADEEKVSRALAAEALTKMAVLKRLAVEGKLKACIKWIEDFLQSDEKLIVYCFHRKIIQQLEQHFKSVCVRVDGSVTGKKRQAAVKAFQTNRKVFGG